MEDPYALYRQRLANDPVFWDEAHRLWAVYPYRYCQQVLSHPATLIPPVADGDLGGQALAIKSRLVRISNPPAHDLARQIALRMFRGRGASGRGASGRGASGGMFVPVGPLLSRLLPPPGRPATVEWVSSVCKVLPAMHILAGLGFSAGDVEFILQRLPAVLGLLKPVTNREMVDVLEAACDSIYPLVDRQVALQFPGLTREAQDYGVSNLIGLLIQSYDATKGLLSLALLHLLSREDPASLASRDMEFFLSFVTEVLRYDSPVHNTRRIAGEELLLDGHVIMKGQTILVVLAAGNRDAAQFARPEQFDRHRANNMSMLTFGHGIHACIAGAYCTELAAEAMCHLFHTYKQVRLEEAPPEYEPLVNVRMVKTMHLHLA